MKKDRIGVWKRTFGMVLLLASAGIGAARAQDAPAGTAVKPTPAASEIGHSAHAWLALQESGAAAAPARPTPGAEAGAAYDRYIKSFSTQIPESFGSTLNDRGVSSGKSAGGLN